MFRTPLGFYEWYDDCMTMKQLREKTGLCHNTLVRILRDADGYAYRFLSAQRFGPPPHPPKHLNTCSASRSQRAFRFASIGR
jgi:hypothetical protein